MTSTIFCLDFDETLANTDRIRADLLEAIRKLGGEDLEITYSEAYEATRQEYGVVRIPLVLKTMVDQLDISAETHRQLADIFHNHPYQKYIYPGAEKTINTLKEQGRTLLLSDGDAFFQVEKIYATSVARMVDGVVILPSKIDHFTDLANYYPADQYVFIDDKQKVLNAAKEYFGDKSTTVLVRQGRYTTDSQPSTADKSVATIGEVAALFPKS